VYPTHIDYMSSMVGVLKTGTAYSSRSPGFTPAFDGIRVSL